MTLSFQPGTPYSRATRGITFGAVARATRGLTLYDFIVEIIDQFPIIVWFPADNRTINLTSLQQALEIPISNQTVSYDNVSRVITIY